jgi:hypothetical protein
LSKDEGKAFLKRLLSGQSGGCCCCTAITGAKYIDVDGSIVGIYGLEEIFQRLHNQGRAPDDLSGDELLEEVSKSNCLTEDKKEVYKEAFLREYKRYFDCMKR